MRVFLSGNEEVARFHLPVAKSMAAEFAKRTEKSGLKQNAFSVLFKETGARAAMTYAFGEINLSVDAPFSGKVEEGVLIQERRLYEWNNVANIDRVCRGERGILLGKDKCYICKFDEAPVLVECGSIAHDDPSIPEEMASHGVDQTMWQSKRYIDRAYNNFFSSRLDYFFRTFATAGFFILSGHGLFRNDFAYFSRTQLFRMDEIYKPPSYSGGTYKTVNLPSSPICLSDDGNMYVYDFRLDELSTSTLDLPVIVSSIHSGTNMFTPQLSYRTDPPRGVDSLERGIWSGPYRPIRGRVASKVAHFTGSTFAGDIIYQEGTVYDDDLEEYTDFLNTHSCFVTLNVVISYSTGDGILNEQTFNILSGHEFSLPVPENAASNLIFYEEKTFAVLEERYDGSGNVVGGDYVQTIGKATPEYFGSHIFIDIPQVAEDVSYNFFFWNGVNFDPYYLTLPVGYTILDSKDYVFGMPVGMTSYMKYFSVEEQSSDRTSFLCLDYYRYHLAEGNEDGTTYYEGWIKYSICEIVISGDSATFVKHFSFLDFYGGNGFSGFCFFWFSENYNSLVFKGSQGCDGYWYKSSGTYTKILDGMSSYFEPVYMSKDGSVVAFKDKIYINGYLVIEPVECVGVFHTHDYFVDKISDTQFAIKDMLGNVVSTTPDGLYNYYELTEDSSYALLSKAWWNEDDDKSTDVALIVGFADGPVKFETADQPLLQQIDPSINRSTPRFAASETYRWPTTWSRCYAPQESMYLVYGKMDSRTLVSCREDGFAERARNFSAEERVSAFLWHPVLGLLQRLENTVTEIPESLLHQRTETRFEEE